MLTLAAVMLFVYHDGTKEFAEHNFYVVIVAIVVMFITIVCITAFEGIRRKSPTNFIFLLIFTISEAYMVGFATMCVPPETVSYEI